MNTEGKVIATQQYKNSLNVPPTPLVKLNETNLNYNETGTDAEKEKGFNFNKLGIINDKYIFTFTSDALYVFDPERLDLVLWNNDVRNIVDVKCFQDTLYVWSSHNKVNVFTLSPLDKCLLRLYFNENYLTCARLTIHFANHLLNSPALLHSLHHLNDLSSKLKRYDNIDNLNENLQPILNELSKYSQENRVVKLNSGIYVVNNEHNINRNQNQSRSSSVPREKTAQVLSRTNSTSSTSLPDLDHEDDEENESQFLTINSPDLIHDALVELGNNVSDSLRHILDVRKPKTDLMEPFDVGKPDFLLGLNKGKCEDPVESIVKKNRRNRTKLLDTSELVATCDKYNAELNKFTPNEFIKTELELKLLNLLVRINSNLKQNSKLSAQYLQAIYSILSSMLSNSAKLKQWLLSNEISLLDIQSPDNLSVNSPAFLAKHIKCEKRFSMVEASVNSCERRPRNHSLPNPMPNSPHPTQHIYKEMFTFDNQPDHSNDHTHTSSVFSDKEQPNHSSDRELPHSESLIQSQYRTLLEESYPYEDIYIDILMSKLLEKLSQVVTISTIVTMNMLVNLSTCYLYSLSTVLSLQEQVHVDMKQVDSKNILTNLNMILILLQLGHMVTCVEMFLKCGEEMNLRLISYIIIKLYTRYIENGLMEHEAYVKCNHLFLTFLNHLYIRDITLNFQVRKD